MGVAHHLLGHVGVARHLSGHVGVARHLSGHVRVVHHLSGHVGVVCHLSGHVGVVCHLSGNVGVVCHLSGQALKRRPAAKPRDGQRTWTATGHLIVPALSRRRACRGEPLGVSYTNKHSHIVSVLSLVFPYR